MYLTRRPVSGSSGPPGDCVATIGVFDGVHLGHQRILGRVLAEARARGLASLVFSFEPTPREYFSVDDPPARLMRFREKYDALRAMHFDRLHCPPFDARLESLEPQVFMEQLLSRELGVRHLVVGDDFRFARRRAGTLADLRAAGPRLGFSVEQVTSVSTPDGLRVSSTAIRDALAAGDTARASELLGRPYAMTGRVVSGLRLGQELGMPTANVNLCRRLSPVAGIFAVRVGGIGAELLPGVASVGTRPTVDDRSPLLEVHIFDFARELYGRYIHVQFIAKLRDEVKFPDLQSLQRQMHLDAAEARRVLAA